MTTAAELLWHSLRYGWWLILLAALIAVVTAAGLTANRPVVYQSVVEMAVTPNTSVEDDGDILDAIELLDRRSLIATLARVPETSEVKERAAQRIGWAEASENRYRVRTRLEPYTFIVRVEVSGPEQDKATQLADSVAWTSRRESHGLYRLFSLRSIGQARARGQVRSDPGQDYVVAAILGAFAGLLAAMLLTSRRLRAAS